MTAQTHALIKNVDRASRASNSAEVKKNADGSVDLYFGPKAPAGKESNWMPTDPAREFELMFRLYAPTKALFDKTGSCRTSSKAQLRNDRSATMKKLALACVIILAVSAPAASAQASRATPCRSPSTISSAPSPTCIFGNIVKDGGARQVPSPPRTGARSTIKPSSASTATRSIPRRCSISTPDR